MAVAQTDQKQNFPLALLKLVFLFVQYLFPSIVMLKVRSLVSKATFTDDPWVKKQMRKSLVAAVALLIPTAIGFIGIASLRLDFLELKKAHPINLSIVKNQFKKSSLSLSESEAKYFKKMFIGDLILVSVPILVTIILTSQITFIKETKALKKKLIDFGIQKEGEDRLAVVLPIGIVMDISGYSAKDIVLNEGIWTSIGVEVDQQDWERSPRKNSLVMFRRQFRLSNSYVF